jgi:hypothetical protein
MAGVLAEADVIAIVASPAVDSARSALATLDWLERQGYSHLAPGATVVVSASRPGAIGLDIDQFSRQTRQAFLALAATIADSFSSMGDAARFTRR